MLLPFHLPIGIFTRSFQRYQGASAMEGTVVPLLRGQVALTLK